MMRINTTAMAMTSSRWMNPPSVVEVTTPNTHRINSTTKMVHNICPLAFNQIFNPVILCPAMRLATEVTAFFRQYSQGRGRNHFPALVVWTLGPDVSLRNRR